MKTFVPLLFHTTLAVLLLIFAGNVSVEGALTDYFTSFVGFFWYGDGTKNEVRSIQEFKKTIPYEVSSVDEKFISKAVELTGVPNSELDSCQQRVVLRLKTDCNKMNDEELAKMAVHLLNCQSFVEGRKIFTCMEEMSIKQCTSAMDSDTWNSYLLMSNRAKAVCYMIRKSQFTALGEHTVNKLMEASQNQLGVLEKISTNQENILGVAEKTSESLAKGQNTLFEQQKDLEKAQLHGQLVIEENIRRLASEKQLIRDTHNTLVQMTKEVQSSLASTAKMVADQHSDTKVNHAQLLEDVNTIQKKASALFDRIEGYSEMLLKQKEEFQGQYEATLNNLNEVNETMHALVNLVKGTRQTLEEKVSWILTALGGTDQAVERLNLVFSHVCFSLVAMLGCAFLSAKPSTRLAIISLPPINLVMAVFGNSYLGLQNLLLATATIIIVQMLGTWAWKQRKSSQAIGLPASKSLPAKPDSCKSFTQFSETDKLRAFQSNPETLDDYAEMERNETDYYSEHFQRLTPPISRNGHYPNLLSRSRSNTPLRLNEGLRGSCRAKTRAGTPCKLSAITGRDYCYRHQTGDSIMG
ncbi:protein brambleberry [Dendroctonus ponderosae]